MGQQQSKTPFNPNSTDQDLQSDIFESQTGSIHQRRLQAVRISECDRGWQQPSLNSTQKQESIDLSEDTLKIAFNILQTEVKKQKILLQGVLIKQSPNSLFGQWTQRFCYLTSNKFVYLEGKVAGGIKAGTLNFDLLSCNVNCQKKNERVQNFTIKVNGCDKQFIFSAQNKNDNKKWVASILESIKKSYGQEYNLTYLSHYHRFWRKDYFSQKEFREKAQTGDIILMRGSKQAAVMQRAITQEEYDHVALVVKNIKGQVLLFEANGAVGVGIMPWHRFISKEYFKHQEIVVYRKLHIERNKQFYTQIQDFVQRNMGRKYKFSVKKFIMNRESNNQDCNTYFCSSLIAKIYKNLGLLDEKVSSIIYMPHSFTEKDNLELRQNGKYGSAKLGNQHIIVFEKRFFDLQ